MKESVLLEEFLDDPSAAQIEERLEAVRNELALLRRATSEPGFELLAFWIRRNMETALAGLSRSWFTSIEEQNKDQFTKGIASGLERVLGLPAQIEEAYRQEVAGLERLLEIERKKDERRNRAEPGDASGTDANQFAP